MNPSEMNTQQVAIGCLHVLMGRAFVEFPGSTRARPSPNVIVTLTINGPLKPTWKPSFPVCVPGDLWHLIVVPVLRELRSEGYARGFQPGDRDQDRAVSRIKMMLDEQLAGSVGNLPT